MSIYESVFKDLFLTILELIDYSYSEMLNDVTVKNVTGER